MLYKKINKKRDVMAVVGRSSSVCMLELLPNPNSAIMCFQD